MGMPLWLTRPREFEQLDQAINDACCAGDTTKLDAWVDALKAVLANPPNTPTPGIGVATGIGGTGQSHFAKHWVGDYAKDTPPEYWPYAWGKAGGPSNERVLIDRLLSFGLMWSIKKVSEARKNVASLGPNNHPKCSDCRTHITIWVCAGRLEPCEEKLAYADVESRKKLFRVGVIESRDAVALVILTPHPDPLVAGVCDPTHTQTASPDAEPMYREPVIVTAGWTAGDETRGVKPKWIQPATGGSTIKAPSMILPVQARELPGSGNKYMPAGTYPDNMVVYCPIVQPPTNADGIGVPTNSFDGLIKAYLTLAANPESRLGLDLDLNEGLINRLRITIDDHDEDDHRVPEPRS
jgi:hypothetical protein